MKTTTLRKIRDQLPCERSWSKLLKSLRKTQVDDDPITLVYIYETLCFADAFWALRAVEPELVVELACCYAEAAVQVNPDPRVAEAIKVARAVLAGRASREEAYDAVNGVEAASMVPGIGTFKEWAARSAAEAAWAAFSWKAEALGEKGAIARVSDAASLAYDALGGDVGGDVEVCPNMTRKIFLEWAQS